MMDSNSRTRPSLLARVKQGDTTAWNEFDELYRRILRGYARAWRLEGNQIEDVVQHCMLKFTEHVGSFEYNPQRGFRKWLRTLVNNYVRNLFRKKREEQLKSGVLAEVRSTEPPAEDLLDDIEREHAIEYCLEQLRRSERNPKVIDAFMRVAIEQQPTEKAATALGMSRNQVYLAKHHVTRRLRELCTEQFPELF